MLMLDEKQDIAISYVYVSCSRMRKGITSQGNVQGIISIIGKNKLLPDWNNDNTFLLRTRTKRQTYQVTQIGC